MPLVGHGTLIFLLEVNCHYSFQKGLPILLSKSWAIATMQVVAIRSGRIKITIFVNVDRDVKYVGIAVKGLLNTISYPTSAPTSSNPEMAYHDEHPCRYDVSQSASLPQDGSTYQSNINIFRHVVGKSC